MVREGIKWEQFATKIKLNNIGDNINKNLIFLEKGCNEPTIENKKPQIGAKSEKSKKIATKSKGINIFVFVKKLPIIKENKTEIDTMKLGTIIDKSIPLRICLGKIG